MTHRTIIFFILSLGIVGTSLADENPLLSGKVLFENWDQERLSFESQKTFVYGNDIPSLLLNQPAESSEGLFIYSTRDQKRVCGSDFSYRKDNHEVSWNRSPLRFCSDNQKTELKAVPENTVLYVYYRPKGELEGLRKEFGDKVSVRALDILQNLKETHQKSPTSQIYYQERGETLRISYRRGQFSWSTTLSNETDIDEVKAYLQKIGAKDLEK